MVVFLVQSPENSFPGNPALVPFFAMAEAEPGDPQALAALRLLTGDGLALPPGFQTMIPDAVEVVGVTRSPSDQLITVDMNQAFVDGAGGLLADFTMLNQLIFTAGDGEEISEVLFTVGGEPVTAFGSEGLDLSQPLGRDAFLDQLNSVNLDSAVTGTGRLPAGDLRVRQRVRGDGEPGIWSTPTATSCTRLSPWPPAEPGCWGASASTSTTSTSLVTR